MFFFNAYKGLIKNRQLVQLVCSHRRADLCVSKTACAHLN